MPRHTEDARVKTRLRDAQSRGQIPKATRATSGNAPQASTRQAFESARSKVRGAARTTGRVVGATTAEVGGVAGELGAGVAEGLGVTEQAKAGASRAQRGLKVAGQAAKDVGAKAKALPGRLAKGTLKLGAKALPGVGAAFLAAEATKPTEQLIRQSGVGGGTVTPLRGTDQGPEGNAPVNLERFFDPVLAAAQPAIGAIRGALGFEAEGSEEPPPGTQTATQAQGAQVPGATPPGAPAPNVDGGGRGARGAFSGGERFTPAPGTGTITNERTGRQIDLNFPQQAAAQPGLRAAAPAGPTVNEDITQKLADQARGGGIASAFGAIASGGNVLREQAGQRQRQFQQQEQRAELDNKLSIAIGKATATLPLDQQKAAFEQQSAELKQLSDAEDSGNEGAASRQRASIFSRGIQDIDGPSGGTASVLASQELNKFVEDTGILDAIGLGPGRNLFEVISESEEPVVSLNPENTVFFDRASGEIQQASQTEGESPQKIIDFSATSPELQDFLRAKGILRDKEGKFEQGGPSARNAFR